MSVTRATQRRFIERPTRVECDGVTQGHAVDAFERVSDHIDRLRASRK
jgi:hypothetical protein